MTSLSPPHSAQNEAQTLARRWIIYGAIAGIAGDFAYAGAIVRFPLPNNLRMFLGMAFAISGCSFGRCCRRRDRFYFNTGPPPTLSLGGAVGHSKLRISPSGSKIRVSGLNPAQENQK